MDIKTDSTWLMHGDCLERMKEIESGSVDAIICDPPYGTMNTDGGRKLGIYGWDSCIDTKAMLDECNRVLRTNGALILFSQEPYTSHLITNAHGNLPFSYRMIWLKDNFANALGAKKAPVNYFEDVCVFRCKKGILANHDYDGFHPLRDYSRKILEYTGETLKTINAKLGHRRAEHFFYVDSTQFGLCTEETYKQICDLLNICGNNWFLDYSSLMRINAEFKDSIRAHRNMYLLSISNEFPVVFNLDDGSKYKSNVLQYKKDYTGLHPTQKPIALMEDLIKTYTNKGNTVLDFTAGSGSTGVACRNTARRFIGIELDDKYFEIAKDRILNNG